MAGKYSLTTDGTATIVYTQDGSAIASDVATSARNGNVLNLKAGTIYYKASAKTTISLKTGGAQDQWAIKLKDGTSQQWSIDDIEEMYENPITENDTHEAVDLGLSVKWAKCNVGANYPADYGDYFAWGETTGYNAGKTTFDWSTYTYTNKTNSVLEASDDAATVNWGDKWRMPTYDEMVELKDKCTWELRAYIDTNGNYVSGYKVTGPSGNFIFLPAAGYKGGSQYPGSYYWTSSFRTYDFFAKAHCLYFDNGVQAMTNDDGYNGHSVRPVTK